LTPKTKTTTPKAAGIDAFNVTTAQIGREFPVLFGTRKLTGPNIVWYGDLKSVAVKEKVKTGLFSSTKVTVGYKYYLGMHMVLAHDIDSVSKIETVEGDVMWTGTSTGGAISINKPSLFGGDKSGGGICGTVDFERGLSSQTRNTYLQSVLGTDIPAFRGVACLVLNQVYLGT
jgi:hypothetical protein